MLSGIILAHLIFSFTPHLSEYGVIGCASTEAPSNNSQTLTLTPDMKIVAGTTGVPEEPTGQE